MKRIRPLLMLAVIVMLTFSCAAVLRAQSADEWSFNLSPVDGNISGAPSATIGWGYMVANQSTSHWLFLDGVYSDVSIEHAAFNNIFGLPVLAPGSIFTVDYDDNTGLAGLTWDADAPIGFANTGNLLVQGYWYDGDPFDMSNPGNFVDDAGTRSAPYSATVVAPAAVPEPSTLAALLVGGASLLLLRGIKLRRRIRPF